MEALKCYSLYGSKITDGITVSDFESVVTVEPSVTKIKQAVLQTLPIVAKCAQKGVIDFRRIAGYSLSFVHEVTGKSTLSKAMTEQLHFHFHFPFHIQLVFSMCDCILTGLTVCSWSAV